MCTIAPVSREPEMRLARQLDALHDDGISN